MLPTGPSVPAPQRLTFKSLPPSQQAAALAKGAANRAKLAAMLDHYQPSNDQLQLYVHFQNRHTEAVTVGTTTTIYEVERGANEQAINKTLVQARPATWAESMSSS